MPELSQAIATRSVVAHELETVQRFLTEARNRAHILTPFARSNVPYIPDGWDVYFHQYKISTERDDKGDFPDGEVYAIKGTPRVALTKIGLWRLEQLAGVSWEEPRTGKSTITRVDDTNDSRVCRYQATAYIRDIDGQLRFQSDGFGLDLRDDSDQAKARTPNQLAKDRQNIEQVTITKCKLRVLRALLGVQSSYKPEELQKPFVVFKMQFNIDRMDPDIKKKLDTVMAAKQMGIEKELFGLLQAQGASAQGLIDAISTPAKPPLEVHPPLDLPPVTDPIPPAEDPDEAAERKYWTQRQETIAHIELLYKAKKGKSRAELSPTKPPLKDLTDADLAEIEKALSIMTDIRGDLI